MKSILIELDEPTYKSLNHIAPAARRKRTLFIREAIRKAVREAEYEQIRRAYKKQPDSEAGADDWSTAEEFQP